MKSLKERLEQVMTEKGWEHADVVRISGQSSSAVSQWLGKGSKEIKTIKKMEAAMRLANESGFNALWIAEGRGAERRLQATPSVSMALSGGPFSLWHFHIYQIKARF